MAENPSESTYAMWIVNLFDASHSFIISLKVYSVMSYFYD